MDEYAWAVSKRGAGRHQVLPRAFAYNIICSEMGACDTSSAVVFLPGLLWAFQLLADENSLLEFG